MAEILETGLGIDYEAYEMLSIDLFDTLLLRAVDYPKRVFELLAEEYSDRWFSDRRSTFEAIARKKKLKVAGTDEIKIEEIYEYLEYDSQAELLMEIALIGKNSEIAEAILLARESGLKIAFTSDTYFSEVFIRSLLHKLDIALPDYMFLSSELGASKARGSLFEIMLERSQMQPQKILHVGDNQISDVQNAHERNIATLHYDISRRRTKQLVRRVNGFRASLDKTILNALAERAVLSSPEMTQYWYRIGYEIAGPMAVALAEWIYDECCKENIDSISFVARDGYLVRRAFQVLSNGGIRDTYLLTSRLMLTKVMVLEDYAEFIQELGRHKRSTIYEIFDAYSIPKCGEEECAQILLHFETTRPDSVKNVQDLREYLLKHQNAVVEQFRREAIIHKSYLQKSHEGERVGYVDIGWHATSQTMIERILGKDLHGFYWGIWPWVQKPNVKAFAFVDQINPSLRAQAQACPEIVEFILSAPHGTVISTDLDEEGTNYVHRFATEASSQYQAKGKIEDGANQFLLDWMQVRNVRKLTQDPHLISSKLGSLIYDPTDEDLSKFGSIQHSILPGSASGNTLILDRDNKFPLWRHGEIRARYRSFRMLSLLRLLRIAVAEFGFTGTVRISLRKIQRSMKSSR